MTRLVIVGGGRMGGALLAGLLDAGWAEPNEVAVVEPDPERRADLGAAFAGLTVAGEVPAQVTDAVIAVKPAQAPDVVRTLASRGVGRILSLAAGVTTAVLDDAAGAGVAVVRSMPNTPALVGAGAAAVCGGRAAGEDDLAWAESILSAVGTVARVPEPLLDAVTGLSGSGPAYVFLFAEALVDAGVAEGLARPDAERLAYQTLLGAARMLVEGDRHPAELRNDVTSPGGTTAAGLRALEDGGLRSAVAAAVHAATARSAELGRR